LISRLDECVRNQERRTLDLEHAVYGNGNPGIKMTVAQLKNWMDSEVELQKENRAYQRQMRLSLIMLFVAQIIAIGIAIYKR
jgi:hypothetical protein